MTTDRTRIRLLVVEDDIAVQRVIKRVAAQAGYEVIQALDGETGWTIACEMKPDVILLDITLPELDGRDLLSRLKKSEATSHIPVVIYSGHDEQHERLLGLELGAEEYITKPIEPESVIHALNSVLRKSRGM